MADIGSDPLPQATAEIVGTAKAAPTSVYTVYKATRRSILKGITITNTQAPGNPEQVFVGVRYENSTGTADWEVMVAPYMEGGCVFGWDGLVYLSAGDEVVGFGSVGSYSTVTLSIEVQ